MERTKISRHISSPQGKILVFGGVYSNLQALEKLKFIAESANIPFTNVFCTGDIVAYCAQPEESVNLIQDWGINCIAGNVEISIREDEDDCGCNFKEGGRCDLFSRKWFPFAKSRLSKASVQWLEKLPDFLTFNYGNRKVMIVHGSFLDTSEYVFESTSDAVFYKNFKDSGADLILAGHCGIPFSRSFGNMLWLNAGVIGMPANDSTPRVWYLILDQKEGKVQFRHHAFTYDHELSASLMKKEGLPETYAQTLSTGLWDNCEILPKEETEKTGSPILLT